MTCSDINTLTRQKELLLQKLSTFEETNRTLRDLLREQHSKEVSSWLRPSCGLRATLDSTPPAAARAPPLRTAVSSSGRRKCCGCLAGKGCGKI